MAWCILGDFNKITTQDEKIGSQPRPSTQMDNFRLALERNGLVDLGWKNQKFIWSNRHKNETFTKEMLDQVVANKNMVKCFWELGCGCPNHLLFGSLSTCS